VIHLALALVLYVALLWTALTVLRPNPVPVRCDRLMHQLAWICCALVAITMLAGGFVAGTRAGFEYNTFPWMDGQLVPSGYAQLQPFWRNLMENLAAVQFDHRLLATLTALVVVCTCAVGLIVRLPPVAHYALLALGMAAAVQYLLGVATLLSVVEIDLAATHQAMAVLLLTSAVVLLHATRPIRPTPPQ
jgi:cytochrome c oxidase assembly protein subunit 15